MKQNYISPRMIVVKINCGNALLLDMSINSQSLNDSNNINRFNQNAKSSNDVWEDEDDSDYGY